MKKKILFINKSQFGYHTDYYKYCEYLRDHFDVSFICFDTGLEKLEIDNVNVKYISNANHKILRGIRFFIFSYLSVLKFNGKIFIHYFPNCHVLKCLIPWKKMILDIRTLSIHKNKAFRIKADKKIKHSTHFFNHITIISEGLRNKLNLDINKSSILPLGADEISSTNKTFESIKLLYVGTLRNREIHKTIEGLKLYLDNCPETTNITYDIIGDGEELSDIKNLVLEKKLSKQVIVHGRIPHFKIKPFFDNCNVGVSFVPTTEYYEFQPVTKTFEYILSGIPCIATNTYENRISITKTNGVLCESTPESFANAIDQIIKNKLKYNSSDIRETLSNFTWGKIVQNKLYPILKSI